MINLLVPGARRPAPNLALLAVLAILLLLAGYWLQNRYAAKEAVDNATERKTVESREVQKELSAEQADIERLRSQIAQLTAQQEPVAESINWGIALTALFQAGDSLVTFQSIQGEAGGELAVDGTLVDVQALASFDAALQDVSDLIDVQSLEWDQQKDGLLTLNATIKEQR